MAESGAPLYPGGTVERRRYLVVMEVESNVKPDEGHPSDFFFDMSDSVRFKGTSDEWYADSTPRVDAEVVEISAVKDMGAAD